MRRLLLILASLIVSGVFLWLALRDVPLADVAEHIRRANILWIAISFALIGLGLWARGVRWSGLLDHRIPISKGFYLFTITMFVNLLPLRAGELVRTVLATRYGVPLVTAGASIIVERLIDVVAVVVLLAIGITQLPSVPPTVTSTITVFAILAVVAFAVLIVFARFPQIAHGILAFIEQRLPVIGRLGLRKRLDEVLDGLHPFTHLRSAGHAILWTIISWGASLVTFYTLQLAFGVESQLWLMSDLSITLASLGAAIPVTVASIGPFQGAVRLAGEMVGMESTLAASLGIVFHGLTVLGYAVFGVISLMTLGISLGDVLKRQEAASPIVPDIETS